MNEFLAYIASLNPNYDLEGIKKAYETAERMHRGQLRKSGEPYIIHPVETAKILARLGMDEQTIIAGLLHDVVEDTSVNIEELEREFPKEVTDALRLLTHADGTDYFDYVRAIGKNPVAKAIKLADLEHNSDQTRFAGCVDVTQEQLDRWKEKYDKARAILKQDE